MLLMHKTCFKKNSRVIIFNLFVSKSRLFKKRRVICSAHAFLQFLKHAWYNHVKLLSNNKSTNVKNQRLVCVCRWLKFCGLVCCCSCCRVLAHCSYVDIWSNCPPPVFSFVSYLIILERRCLGIIWRKMWLKYYHCFEFFAFYLQ